ncbi:MAG: efflux RND transporter periplasmic adaptor subunit [Rikenellaceae bacterium]
MKRLTIVALATVIATGCGASQSDSKTTTTSTAEEQAKPLTKTEVAVAQEVQLLETFTSEINPFKEVDITPAASGVKIEKITVDVGDNVHEGQLLVSLDPTQYNQQMLQVNTLKADYERLKAVYEAGGISRQTFEQAQMSYEVQAESARNTKKNIEILSPISGVVTARNSEVGNMFMNQPILHIAQIDKLKVIVEISEQFFPSVKVGMPVNITLEIYPDEVFEGKVSLIHPALDSTSRTFTVEVTIPNTANKLRPGMFARAEFSMGSKDGIMVPDVAVQKQYGSAENYVFVIKNGVVESRSVKVGRQVGSYVDILSGLELGEEVAVTAFSRISDGVAVDVKN